MGEEEFLEILSHDVRRRIVDLVNDRVEVSYSDLLEALKVGDGTLNFHLGKMTGLLQHTPKGYILSETGRLAVRVLHTVRQGLPSTHSVRPVAVPLTAGLVGLRIGAFVLDALIFFVFTGVFFDPVLWSSFQEAILHLSLLAEPHPWLFHPEHLSMLTDVAFRLVGVYAHIFFAVYIFITTMEAFKGQTPGKYVFGVRVVKVGGSKVGLLESAIRNAGKVFLLPLDLMIGLIFYSRRGFIRFFDYYTESTIERVVPREASKTQS